MLPTSKVPAVPDQSVPYTVKLFVGTEPVLVTTVDRSSEVVPVGTDPKSTEDGCNVIPHVSGMF